MVTCLDSPLVFDWFVLGDTITHITTPYSSPSCTGPQVPSHLSSTHAISAVESMEGGAYHFTLDPKYDMDA